MIKIKRDVMIKIMSIEIDGFIVKKQKVKLDFIDSNIVCIYGDNGSGNTTFLGFCLLCLIEEIKI